MWVNEFQGYIYTAITVVALILVATLFGRVGERIMLALQAHYHGLYSVDQQKLRRKLFIVFFLGGYFIVLGIIAPVLTLLPPYTEVRLGVNALVTAAVAAYLVFLFVHAPYPPEKPAAASGPVEPSPPPFSLTDFRARLQEKLWRVIVENKRPVPPEHVMNLMLDVGEQLMDLEQLNAIPRPELDNPPHSYQLDKLKWWERRFDFLEVVVTHSLTTFLDYLPAITPSPLRVPLYDRIEVSRLIYDMERPFASIPYLNGLGYKSRFHETFQANVIRVTQQFGKPGAQPIYPQDFRGSNNEAADIYLRDTPIQVLLALSVPLEISEDDRTKHHYVLGATGSGKTTYLSHWIKSDLQQVIDGKASLVVLDSQKTLINAISHLKLFAPGQPLHDRLIIIDAKTPLGINLFKSEADEEGVVSLVSLATTTSSEATTLQAGPLKQLVRATLRVPNPTLPILFQMGKPKGYMKFEKWWRKDPALKEFFTQDFIALPAPTRQGIQARFTNFAANPKLCGVFSAVNCELDLFAELERGVVLLLDADHEEFPDPAERELFGRVFLSMLRRVADRRDENKNPKHVWAYIEEAHEYISGDQSIRDMLLHARKKAVGLTICIHREGDMSPDVIGTIKSECHLAALCEGREHVVLTEGKLRLQKTHDLRIKKFEWNKEPMMSPEEYDQVRAEIAAKYPARFTEQAEDTQDFSKP